jgi:hypothetical protein
MNKVLLSLFLVFLCVFQLKANNPNTLLFGYISEDPSTYYEVIDYLADIDIEVIEFCEEEKLICVQLTEEYKDFAILFEELERYFGGKCYQKNGKIDDAGRYSHEIRLKQKLEK